jgi:hypothetical protein
MPITPATTMTAASKIMGLQLTYVKARIALRTILFERTGRNAVSASAPDGPGGGRSARFNGGIERCRLGPLPESPALVPGFCC